MQYSPQISVIFVLIFPSPCCLSQVLSRSSNSMTSRNLGKILQTIPLNGQNTLLMLKQSFGSLRSYLERQYESFDMSFPEDISPDFIVSLRVKKDSDDDSDGSDDDSDDDDSDDSDDGGDGDRSEGRGSGREDVSSAVEGLIDTDMDCIVYDSSDSDDSSTSQYRDDADTGNDNNSENSTHQQHQQHQQHEQEAEQRHSQHLDDSSKKRKQLEQLTQKALKDMLRVDSLSLSGSKQDNVDRLMERYEEEYQKNAEDRRKIREGGDMGLEMVAAVGAEMGSKTPLLGSIVGGNSGGGGGSEGSGVNGGGGGRDKQGERIDEMRGERRREADRQADRQRERREDRQIEGGIKGEEEREAERWAKEQREDRNQERFEREGGRKLPSLQGQDGRAELPRGPPSDRRAPSSPHRSRSPLSVVASAAAASDDEWTLDRIEEMLASSEGQQVRCRSYYFPVDHR